MEKKKNIQHKKPVMTLDKLATLIQGQFSRIDEIRKDDLADIKMQFSALDQRFDSVDERFDILEERFDVLEKNNHLEHEEIRGDFKLLQNEFQTNVYNENLYELDARLTKVEFQLKPALSV